jgi:ABC-type branched-subunit amino acid transport system substrate-binding protein
MEYTLAFLKDEGYERLAVYYAADDFGKGVVDSIEDYSNQVGLEVVDRTTTINSANIERVMARWDALDVEILIIGETYEWVKDIIKEIKRRNKDILIVGTSSLDYPEYIPYLGDYAEGTIIPTHFQLNRTTKENMSFVEAFRKKYDMILICIQPSLMIR